MIRVLDPEGRALPLFEALLAGKSSSRQGDWKDGRFELPAGHTARWIEIRRPRARDGAPVAGLEVSAARVLRPPTGGVRIGGRHAEVRTDAEGRFELMGLGEGRSKVLVSVPSRYAPIKPRFVHADARGLTFTVQPALALRLRVVDERGKEVPGARVRVRTMRGGGLCWDKADAKGEVLLVGLAPDGLYRLAVSPPAARLELGGRYVEGWSPAQEDLVLPEAWALRGRVVDPTGRPVSGAVVHALVREHEWWARTESAADGTFAREGGRVGWQRGRTAPRGGARASGPDRRSPEGGTPAVLADDAALVRPLAPRVPVPDRARGR